MKAIRQRVPGYFNQTATHNVFTLDITASEFVTLRYALVVGDAAETHLFPSFLLDDWGGEVRKVALYSWIRDYGVQFPRAEVFGHTIDGVRKQVFLRDIELLAPFPCYAFESPTAALATGKRVHRITLKGEGSEALTRIQRPLPKRVKFPLSNTDVRWFEQG